MKETGTVGVTAEASMDARRRSLVAREKWEESWISQQRGVTAVVTHEPAQQSAEPEARSRQLSHGPEMSADGPTAPHASNRLAPIPFADSNRSSGEAERNSAARAPAPPAPTLALSTSTLPHGGDKSLVRASRPSDGSTPPETRHLKHFAFWRNQASVEVAMRLRDPQRDAHGVLAQLRQWLRDGGVQLGKVFINGRPSWDGHSPGGEPASQDRPSRLNRHI